MSNIHTPLIESALNEASFNDGARPPWDILAVPSRARAARICNPLIAQNVELAFDLLALVAAWRGTIELRLLLNPFFSLGMDRGQLFALAPPLWIVLILWTATQLRLVSRRREEADGGSLRMAESALIVGTCAVIVTFFSRGFGPSVSRSFVVLFSAVSYIMLVLARSGEAGLWRVIDRKWPSTRRVAVVGDPSATENVVRCMQLATAGAVKLVGHIFPNSVADDRAGACSFLGRTNQLAELINVHALDQVIVLAGSVSDEELKACTEVMTRMGVTMSRVISSGTGESRVAVTKQFGLYLVDFTPVHFTAGQRRLKRIVDVLGSGALLVLLAPVMLACVAAIKATSPGPVLYRSRRVGMGGRHFMFLKFRSMHDNKDSRDMPALQNEKSGHIFKIRNDPRVTRLGAFMRRYSLDELPQLLNVLRGDMSLIGPRPLPASDLDPDGLSRTFEQWTRERATVPPGITGLWQIRGRSDLDFDAMVQLDHEYIRHWSLFLDLKIVLATPIAVISGRGAY